MTALSDPVFPPLLAGHAVDAGVDPFAQAVAGAREGRLGAGDFVWSRAEDVIAFALVLEPEVPRIRCREMLFLTIVAAGDAIGAISPPHLALTWKWPAEIRANGAAVGRARYVESDEEDENGSPAWLVVGIELVLRQAVSDREPGETPDRTALWEEGAGDLDRTLALEALSRHLLTWLTVWEADGFRPVGDAWLFRADGYRGSISVQSAAGPLNGTFLGLDDGGGLLLRMDEDEERPVRVLKLEDHIDLIAGDG